MIIIVNDASQGSEPAGNIRVLGNVKSLCGLINASDVALGNGREMMPADAMERGSPWGMLCKKTGRVPALRRPAAREHSAISVRS